MGDNFFIHSLILIDFPEQSWCIALSSLLSTSTIYRSQTTKTKAKHIIIIISKEYNECVWIYSNLWTIQWMFSRTKLMHSIELIAINFYNFILSNRSQTTKTKAKHIITIISKEYNECVWIYSNLWTIQWMFSLSIYYICKLKYNKDT